MRKPKPAGQSSSPLDWKKIVSNAVASASGASGEVGRLAKLQPVGDFGPNPGELRMFVYAPASLPAKSPLVVVLHGCGQSAAAYDRGAGWSELADRLGFLLLAPEQNHANNMNGCFNWFQAGDTARGQGEAASMRQMVAHAIRQYGLDPGRVFVTGLSAGGAMTSVMLATYPEVFAAGAVIAGLPYGAASTVQEGLACMRAPPPRSSRDWGDLVRRASGHQGPWPRVSVWHGDADHTVGMANAGAVVAQWTDLHDLHRGPTAQDRVGPYPRRLWMGANGEAVVESYALTGMGHGTPIARGVAPEGCGEPGPFILEAGISSSYRIAEFWGLTRPAVAADPAAFTSIVQHQPARASAAEEATLLDFQPVEAEHTRTFDPGAVISTALRAAGLM